MFGILNYLKKSILKMNANNFDLQIDEFPKLYNCPVFIKAISMCMSVLPKQFRVRVHFLKKVLHFLKEYKQR